MRLGSIRKLLKRPQKYERLFQIMGGLSILALATSIMGVVFMMFYHWYTPWQVDHLISWPEILGMAGLMWSFLIDLIYIVTIDIIKNRTGIYLPYQESWPYILISASFNFIFFVILFLSIKFLITKKYKELTKLTRIIISVFIVVFILNFFTIISTSSIR